MAQDDMEIPLGSDQIFKITCTEVQVEMLPNGAVQITAFEGHVPFRKFVAYPSIVIVDNTAVPKIEMKRVQAREPGDDIPI